MLSMLSCLDHHSGSQGAVKDLPQALHKLVLRQVVLIGHSSFPQEQGLGFDWFESPLHVKKLFIPRRSRWHPSSDVVTIRRSTRAHLSIFIKFNKLLCKCYHMNNQTRSSDPFHCTIQVYCTLRTLWKSSRKKTNSIYCLFCVFSTSWWLF